MILLNKEELKSMIKKRTEDSHKGDFGHLLLCAGSVGMAGAAILCGQGALRTGVGLVRYFIPEELFTILQVSVPEATCLKRQKKVDLSEYESIVFGPGLGIDERETLSWILKEYDGKLVLDADGLNQIALFELKDLVRKFAGEIILTPHLGEARRLLPMEKPENRMSFAMALANEYRSTVVLKGKGTIIALPEGETYVNPTGNSGMATGGSGDVLAGVIGGLLAQGYTVKEASLLGTYAHGLSGDLCKEQWGEEGMKAGDLPEAFPLAWANIRK